MEAVRKFLARKNIVFSAKRYFIDAMGAMAQGLFCTLLVGTILNTLGQQFHIGFLNAVIVTLGKGDGAVSYTIGGLCSAMVGPGMAVAIARALVNNPATIIADEPTGNLDPERSMEIMTLLVKINQLGTTVLVVTHEKDLVNKFGKRVITIDQGRIINDSVGGYVGGHIHE